MEKLNEDKVVEEPFATSNIKEESAADIPADDIEENRDQDINSETDSDSSSDSSSDSDSDFEYECKVCKKTFSGYLPFRQHQKGKKHAKAVSRKKKEKKLLKIDTVVESDEERLVQEPFAECKTCKKEFYGPEAYEKHIKCKKHKQKVLEASILEKVQEEGKINIEKLQDMHKSKRTDEGIVEHSREKTASFTLEDDEEKDEEFECKECEKIFSGLIPFTQHLMSKSHAKKVGKKDLLHKVIPGTSEEDEISEIENNSALSIEDDMLVCKVCSTSFSGPENAITHLKSKIHAKKVEKNDLLRKVIREASKEDKISAKSEDNVISTLSIEDDVLVCKICSTSFSGPESAISHVKSKKHAKNLEKHVRKLEKKKEKQRTKRSDVNLDEKNEVNSENENQDEITKIKLQPASDNFVGHEELDNSKINAVQSTSSGNQDTEGLIAYQKYKEYKLLMNSVLGDQL